MTVASYGTLRQPATARRWIFRETGRVAFVVDIRSDADRDVVLFRFEDDLAPRRVLARRFLEAFEPADLPLFGECG